jgi:5-(carboxyamino)imidazole ribonucleotide synthase
MNKKDKKKYSLGIFGDGQLARFIAMSAIRHNVTVIILTLDAINSPCKNLAPLFEIKSWNDPQSFYDFCDQCEVVVLENEFIPAEFLLDAENRGTIFYPNAQGFHQVSDKFKQIKICQNLGILTPFSHLVQDPSEVDSLELPVMLKSLTGGYDGYGNFSFLDISQRDQALHFIKKVGATLAQEYMEFDCEVATIVVSDGENYFTFPIVETIQNRNICHFTLTPARFCLKLQENVQEQAKKIIKGIGGIGVFGIEFFKKGDDFFFNEIAPRPHNSGHYTIETCDYSQFDALIKLVLGQKLTQPFLKTPAAGMLNLLGTQNGKSQFIGDQLFYNNPQGFLHLYEKEHSRIGRKMGHFTLLGINQDEILNDLSFLKSRYQI